MVQLIGLMIGAYIFTRMVELLGQEGKPVSKGFAVATLLIVVFCVFGLIMSGNDIRSALPR